ncbi:MAG TPA: hypothetical protein VFW00_13320 [Rhodocyclaceae bacterium]|nr:hypothetical protein [Rhodocyclaceae bacterium]
MSNRHRLIALRLHKLAAADKAWILKRLPESDQASVSGYLDELKSFNIDPASLEDMQMELDDPIPHTRADTVSAPVPAYIVEQVLSLEPAWLARTVHPRGELHTSGVAASSLTGAALKAMEDAFRKQVHLFEAQRAPDGVPPHRYPRTEAMSHGGAFMNRLKSVWRR